MTMVPGQNTIITVTAETDAVHLDLSPVLTGNQRDHYASVELRLAVPDARKLRDDLTQTLALLAERPRKDGSR